MWLATGCELCKREDQVRRRGGRRVLSVHDCMAVDAARPRREPGEKKSALSDRLPILLGREPGKKQRRKNSSLGY